MKAVFTSAGYILLLLTVAKGQAPQPTTVFVPIARTERTVITQITNKLEVGVYVNMNVTMQHGSYRLATTFGQFRGFSNISFEARGGWQDQYSQDHVSWPSTPGETITYTHILRDTRDNQDKVAYNDFRIHNWRWNYNNVRYPPDGRIIQETAAQPPEGYRRWIEADRAVEDRSRRSAQYPIIGRLWFNKGQQRIGENLQMYAEAQNSHGIIVENLTTNEQLVYRAVTPTIGGFIHDLSIFPISSVSESRAVNIQPIGVTRFRLSALTIHSDPPVAGADWGQMEAGPPRVTIAERSVNPYISVASMNIDTPDVLGVAKGQHRARSNHPIALVIDTQQLSPPGFADPGETEVTMTARATHYFAHGAWQALPATHSLFPGGQPYNAATHGLQSGTGPWAKGVVRREFLASSLTPYDAPTQIEFVAHLKAIRTSGAFADALDPSTVTPASSLTMIAYPPEAARITLDGNTVSQDGVPVVFRSGSHHSISETIAPGMANVSIQHLYPDSFVAAVLRKPSGQTRVLATNYPDRGADLAFNLGAELTEAGPHTLTLVAYTPFDRGSLADAGVTGVAATDLGFGAITGGTLYRPPGESVDAPFGWSQIGRFSFNAEGAIVIRGTTIVHDGS